LDGKPAREVTGSRTDRDTYTVTLTHNDGSDGAVIEFRPLLEQFLSETE
jgi:hypothetical protein